MQKKNQETTIYILYIKGRSKGLFQASATKNKLFLSFSLKCAAAQHLSPGQISDHRWVFVKINRGESTKAPNSSLKILLNFYKAEQMQKRQLTFLYVWPYYFSLYSLKSEAISLSQKVLIGTWGMNLTLNAEFQLHLKMSKQFLCLFLYGCCSDLL